MIFPGDSSLCAQARVFWSQRKNSWFAFTIRGSYTLFFSPPKQGMASKEYLDPHPNARQVSAEDTSNESF